MKIVLLLLTVLAVFTGCDKNKQPAPPQTATQTAMVMFVNGCAGTTYVNANIDDTNLTAAGNLTFLKNSGYQAVTAGSNVDLGFEFPGPPATGSGLAISVVPGSHYSFFVGGSLTTTETYTYSVDDLSLPAPGMAKVRFVDLSSDTLNLNCFIGSQKIDSNVFFGTITPFFQVPGTTSGDTVLLQAPSNPIESAILSNQPFISGQIYTIMLTGNASGTLTDQLTLTVINN